MTGESVNFARTFTLPATLDVTTLALTGAIICDKSCLLYINGQFLEQDYEYEPYTARENTFAATSDQLNVGGVNTLTVVLSTINTTADAGVQYNGVRVEGYVNAVVTAGGGSTTGHNGGGGSVLGDPSFVGLLGQSFQVHGIDGAVYNLISDRQVQLNSRFTYLRGGECLRDAATNQPLFTCWTHPGSYLSELALLTNAGDYVRIVAGEARHGFATVEVSSGAAGNGNNTKEQLAVGDVTGQGQLTRDVRTRLYALEK